MRSRPQWAWPLLFAHLAVLGREAGETVFTGMPPRFENGLSAFGPCLEPVLAPLNYRVCATCFTVTRRR